MHGDEQHRVDVGPRIARHRGVVPILGCHHDDELESMFLQCIAQPDDHARQIRVHGTERRRLAHDQCHRVRRPAGQCSGGTVRDEAEVRHGLFDGLAQVGIPM